MSDPKETDERLKTWLNGDQPSRERLCRAVMALDRQYMKVEPRRPEGGPDGARDIQAIDRDSRCVWGAVGFRNSVTDSDEDRRLATKKFRDDLDAALIESPELRSFIFFTNVDMRPSEVKSLRDYASSRGITSVDVYWRERIARALDAPEGLGLRYQYLQLPLSDAEQASFFSRFGKDIEDLIIHQHRSIEERLEGIEFAAATVWPLKSVELTIELQRGVDLKELAGACALIEVLLPNGDMFFAFSELQQPNEAGHHHVRGKCWLWSDKEKSLGGGDSFLVPLQERFHINWGFRLNDRFGSPITMAQLEGCPLGLYLTQPLARCSSRFSILLNDFVAHKRAVEITPVPPVCQTWWKDGLPEEIQGLHWQRVTLVGGATWHRRIALRREHLKIVAATDPNFDSSDGILLGSHEFIKR